MRVNQWTRAGVDKNNDTEWKHVRQHEGRQGRTGIWEEKRTSALIFYFFLKSLKQMW